MLNVFNFYFAAYILVYKILIDINKCVEKYFSFCLNLHKTSIRHLSESDLSFSYNHF